MATGVLDQADHGARVVDHRLPGMRQHDVRVFIECLDASLQQIPGVQVVARGPFEEFSPGLPDKEVMVRDPADVARLPDVADARILPRIAVANIRGAVRRPVIRDDQFEVRVALAE